MAGPPTSGGPVEQSIERALADALAPSELRVINESHMHSGPPGRESHFKVVVVSDAFDGKGMVMRHRLVNRALRPQLDAGLHALSIQAFTPAQWVERGGAVIESPACGGGGEHG